MHKRNVKESTIVDKSTSLDKGIKTFNGRSDVSLGQLGVRLGLGENISGLVELLLDILPDRLRVDSKKVFNLILGIQFHQVGLLSSVHLQLLNLLGVQVELR